jgi:hypothetical protein
MDTKNKKVKLLEDFKAGTLNCLDKIKGTPEEKAELIAKIDEEIEKQK